MTIFHTTMGFEIPVVRLRLGGRKVDSGVLKEKFWPLTEGVAEQHGCYVFSMRAGRGDEAMVCR
jgi:hypothetical protein